MKHLGSKSGNFSQYEWKRWQHRFVGFLKKSQNPAYICEKCKLMGAFLAGERLNSVFWKNRVDGIQKFVQTWKLALKVVKPTIENRKNLENSIWEMVQKPSTTLIVYIFNNVSCIWSHLVPKILIWISIILAFLLKIKG